MQLPKNQTSQNTPPNDEENHDVPSPNVGISMLRRRLFHDDNAQPLFIEDDEPPVISRIREESVKRWNFDFVNERPLPGDWEWEIVYPPKE